MPASIDPMGQICKISKIQDGGGRHLEFRKMPITSAWSKQFWCNFFSERLAPASIDSLGQISISSKIQDDGGRNFGFRNMFMISAYMKQISPNFNSMYLLPVAINRLGQMCKFMLKSKKAVAAILDFKNILIISASIKQFSPNFNSKHLVPISIAWVKNAIVFKSKRAATAGPNSIDVIRFQWSAEDIYLLKAIGGRIRIQ